MELTPPAPAHRKAATTPTLWRLVRARSGTSPPSGRVVTYICIQSGAGSFAGAPGGAHSVPLLLDGLYGLGSCFRVAGIGDATLVVNSICQPIAHVDIFYDAPPTAQLFRVSKNFLPPLIVPPGPQVFIALSCTSGLVSPPSATVGEFFDAFFTVTGAGPNTICTAVELTTVPRLHRHGLL